MVTISAWAFGAVAALAALYGLHRLARRLEEKGLLYYWRKHTQSGSASSVLVPLQEFVQPQVRHVIEVHEQRRIATSDDPGDPPKYP
jgi:hypothetical protein